MVKNVKLPKKPQAKKTNTVELKQADHHHMDPMTEMLLRQIDGRLMTAMPHIVNRSVGAALASAAGSLRERSYHFNPIDPSKLLVKPEPLKDIVGSENVSPHIGVLLHDRLLFVDNSYLLIVSYKENGEFEVIGTTVVEEVLSISTQPKFHKALEQEISRQLGLIPPKEPGKIHLVGVTIAPEYFDDEALKAFFSEYAKTEQVSQAEEVPAAEVKKVGLPTRNTAAVQDAVPKATPVENIEKLKAASASRLPTRK